MGRHVNDPLKEFGSWGYLAGVDGTVAVPSDTRVLGISATAGASGGSIVIDDGDAIPVPANSTIEIQPKANLVAPSIVFDTTEAYIVEYVQDE
jgi:type 1 fimbria pilin